MTRNIKYTHKYHYECLKGYFLQDDAATEPAGFDYVSIYIYISDVATSLHVELVNYRYLFVFGD